MHRRTFIQAAAAAIGAGAPLPTRESTPVQDAGARPPRAEGAMVLNPRGRVPVSLIVDDSTCLVNLAHFAIPQFAEVFPEQYKQAWRDLPREIPDAFVARFADWCGEHGVRGKYSIVPYPACVGWLNRELPGWSRQALDASLALVRDRLMPAWDIHPEMITHTWAIDTRTGRPYPERGEANMENWGFSQTKSADELTDYLAYALRILKNVGLRCEGITTPGGFGSQNRANLALAVGQALSDVFGVEVPHYFRDLHTDGRSVSPKVQNAAGLGGDSPRCVVSVIGGTGDWFGGWDGLERGSADQFVSDDGQSGRLPELIARGEPAIMVCHWPGFYCNGSERGFNQFQTIVRRLEANFQNLIWMKNSEIARYWAARELTAIEVAPDPRRFLTATLRAPWSCPDFTIRFAKRFEAPPRLLQNGVRLRLQEVPTAAALTRNTWCRENGDTELTVCFDLAKGESLLDFAAV